MYPSTPLSPVYSWHAAAISAQHAAELLDKARALQRAQQQQGRIPAALKGKQLALLRDDDEGADAELFRAAAAELGAHVAHVKPALSARSSAQQVQATAHVLSLLYDGVECEGLPHPLVRQLQHAADVPIYDGIACAAHATAALAGQLEGSCPEKKRRLVVQALLLDSLA
ncbi:MAG TPA: ornithine carbamoyltransferase [Albitalea sp.]